MNEWLAGGVILGLSGALGFFYSLARGEGRRVQRLRRLVEGQRMMIAGLTAQIASSRRAEGPMILRVNDRTKEGKKKDEN